MPAPPRRLSLALRAASAGPSEPGRTTSELSPDAARARLEKFWSLGAHFGMERSHLHTFLNEIVSDRYVLVNGLQILRDELQLAGIPGAVSSDVHACGVDFSLPSVVTTLAHTNCGDRIHRERSSSRTSRRSARASPRSPRRAT